MKIVVLGAGYVGLTTSACLAELGHEVTCCDIDEVRVAALARADVPIYEPGLSELIGMQMQAKRLNFTCDPEKMLPDADAVFLAVGTPSNEAGDIDLSYIETAAKGVAPFLRPETIVVIKSTVVAGTAARVRKIIERSRGRADVAVASNPEFLREGSAIGDFMHADRIVIGVDDPASEAVLRQIYAPLTGQGIPLVVTETVNAELIKYAANALLALKIGFINDVADLCEKIGGDVMAVADGVGLDRRIGRGFLTAGPGFGGSCFPKDTRAFASTGLRHGAPQPLIETLIAQNEARKQAVAERIIDAAPANGRVAILGTSFKANTDDVREAASLTVVPLLQEAGLAVSLHDPQPALAKRVLKGAEWHDTALEAVQGADVVVVLTEWDEYGALDLTALAGAMRGNTLLDFRNIIDRNRAKAAGLTCLSLGRAPLKSTRQRRGAVPAQALAASPA
jgi:UDPglucose 6-dehydrogenase